MSYDGMCQKRSNTLHFRVEAIIKLTTGLVLDFSVQRNFLLPWL